LAVFVVKEEMRPCGIDLGFCLWICSFWTMGNWWWWWAWWFSVMRGWLKVLADERIDIRLWVAAGKGKGSVVSVVDDGRQGWPARGLAGSC
jgi:hypothetical protein